MSSQTLPVRRSAPRRGWGLAVGLVAMAGLMVGCSGSPGTQQDFVEVLSRNDYLTEDQATCIAQAVFDEYGDNPDVLGRLSGAGGSSDGSTQYDQLIEGDNAIDGFDEFFTDTVNVCTPAGP